VGGTGPSVLADLSRVLENRQTSSPQAAGIARMQAAKKQEKTKKRFAALVKAVFHLCQRCSWLPDSAPALTAV